LETYQAGPVGLAQDPQAALAPMIAAAEEIAQIRKHTGRTAPDVVT
jgi:phosphoglucomutase